MLQKGQINNYQVTELATEDGLEQILMLYQGIVKYLYAAQIAIKDGDMEGRFNNIEKAIKIITGLQLALDFKQGKEVAERLNEFYNHLVYWLNMVNIKNLSEDKLSSIIEQVKFVYNAWQDVKKPHN